MKYGTFVAAIATLASSIVLVHPPATLHARGFCKTEIIRDYTQPLAGLPALPSPPTNGRLSLGPVQLFVSDRGHGPLQVGAGVRGFGLSFSVSPTDPPTPNPLLDWRVTATLVQIDMAGNPLEVLGRIEESIERPPASPEDDPFFAFAVPPEPGLFRLEIVIQDKRGDQLARFGEYFRSLRPLADFRLRLSRRKVRAGEGIDALLVNPGATYLRFGLRRIIQFHDGSSWVAAPGFAQGPRPAIGLGIGPGESRMCWGAFVPPEARPGLYRFIVPAERF